MEEGDDSDIEIIDFVSSKPEHLSTTSCQIDKSPNCPPARTSVVDQVSVTTMSPISQLSLENIKSEHLSTNKVTVPKETTQNCTSDQMSQPNCLPIENIKSIKVTVKKEIIQNCKSDQMSQPNCLPIEQEIKEEREEEEDTTIDESTPFLPDPNTTTQNNQMSLVKCPTEEDNIIDESTPFSPDPNTTTQNDQMSLGNCQSTEEDMTFEESPLFLSSLKTEESQIKTSETSEITMTSNIEFPSFLDDSLQLSESLKDTSMETSGKEIRQVRRVR
jgi:hypothetical protein